MAGLAGLVSQIVGTSNKPGEESHDCYSCGESRLESEYRKWRWKEKDYHCIICDSRKASSNFKKRLRLDKKNGIPRVRVRKQRNEV